MITVLPDGSAVVLRRCPDCALQFQARGPVLATYCAECRPKRKREQDEARRKALFDRRVSRGATATKKGTRP